MMSHLPESAAALDQPYNRLDSPHSALALGLQRRNHANRRNISKSNQRSSQIIDSQPLLQEQLSDAPEDDQAAGDSKVYKINNANDLIKLLCGQHENNKERQQDKDQEKAKREANDDDANDDDQLREHVGDKEEDQ